MTKPLAIYNRHSLLDGRNSGYVIPAGNEKFHPHLGSWPHNVGDQFVASGLARALDINGFYTLTREATVQQFDFVNDNCEAIIAVMQNALTPGFFENALPVSYLKKIKIPFIMLSLGLQFRFGDEIKLTKGDINSLRYIHDHCVSSQVRGPMSAQLLKDIGIDNTRVLGCPSLLWHGKNTCEIREPKTDMVGFTITDLHSLPALAAYQFQAMESVSEIADRFVPIAQGGEYVMQDYLFSRDAIHPSTRHDQLLTLTTDGVIMEDKKDLSPLQAGQLMYSSLKHDLIAEKENSLDWYYRETTQEIRDAIKQDGFFSTNLQEYIRRSRLYGLMVGTRLHGNIIGLTQGTPAYFVAHDYRLKDICEFLNLPHISADNPEEKFDLGKADWSKFQLKFKEIHSSFKDFFTENNIPHKIN